MPRLVVLFVCCALFVVACGGDDSDEPAADAPTPAASAEEAPAGCKAVEQPDPRPDGDLAKPKGKLDPSKTYVATISTNCGDFEITLAVKQQPKTAASFKHMADEKFFDGLSFHRIAPGFVIQGGDPKGDSTGSAGYSIVETPPKDLVYTKGDVAMAKAQNEPPGTSSSQFFIVTGEQLQLPPDYALVGRVTGGEDTVDKIAVNGNDNEEPIDPVVMSSVTVTTK
ncbi:MAG TPA: peptidylprolyl isomerase [Solirubrobacteraceae bacterium]|nr:peptidylprolyl isomerase [Solirubrobacteraceae bacterium]